MTTDSHNRCDVYAVHGRIPGGAHCQDPTPPPKKKIQVWSRSGHAVHSSFLVHTLVDAHCTPPPFHSKAMPLLRVALMAQCFVVLCAWQGGEDVPDIGGYPRHAVV